MKIGSNIMFSQISKILNHKGRSSSYSVVFGFVSQIIMSLGLLCLDTNQMRLVLILLIYINIINSVSEKMFNKNTLVYNCLPTNRPIDRYKVQTLVANAPHSRPLAISRDPITVVILVPIDSFNAITTGPVVIELRQTLVRIPKGLRVKFQMFDRLRMHGRNSQQKMSIFFRYQCRVISPCSFAAFK